MSLGKTLKYAPFYVLSLLPFWFIFGFAYFAYIILFYVLGYRKKVVLTNLKNSFPEKNDAEIKIILKSFYKHFCEVFLESVKMLTVSKKNIQSRFQFKNIDLINDFYDQNKSIILYGAHFGNWEWMTSLAIQSKHQMLSFYQKQSNSYFNEFMILQRERFGNICVESQSGFKTLLKNTKEGKLTITYVVGDQSPMTKSSMFWTDFLNQDTAFLVGSDRMAKKCNQQLVYPYITQPKKGYYEIEFKSIPMDSDKEPIEYYANFLEENIKQQPELWLWSHKRWKRKRDKKA